MYLPLVVGVDGSEPSMRAVDWAADEAALHEVPLRLVHATLWGRYEGGGFAQEFSDHTELVTPRDILAAAARRVRHRQTGLRLTTAVVPEEPEYVLIREGRNASAVVLGTRGRGGLAGALLGSVSLTVATHADCPVVVVRGGADHPHHRSAGRGPARVVVGVCDIPTTAVRFACREARRRGVPLEAVRAWQCHTHETPDHAPLTGEPDPSYEKLAAKELEAALPTPPPGLTLRRRTAEGPARQVLVTASHDAGLLVVGRRRPGHLGPRLGRVVHAVLHHADCPVVVVPDEA